jgi:hypothetical protein
MVGGRFDPTAVPYNCPWRLLLSLAPTVDLDRMMFVPAGIKLEAMALSRPSRIRYGKTRATTSTPAGAVWII